ncbi:serine hydrolase domain-containing protein [uncultured Aquimarina sp.]|uniref:serine hydrolase domain-containing protein n=1 Tax=uncultured Aquimarina sp. TaxID=575652 RepID=UPI00261D9F6E|nr:serine hydrolase domain-containing protein [uncultured Aquimarina sp.]
MNYILKATRVIALLLFSQSILAQYEVIEKGTIKKIDSLFNFYHQDNQTGSVMSIIQNEKTIYQNYKGLANIEHQIPISNSTVFNIASVSKQFTTFLAMLLEEEGKLSFNDDIRFYIKELKDLPNKITIKQLANHTHGLPNPDELSHLKGVETMNHKEVVEMLLNIKQTNFEAGDKLVYNNTGYILLSIIIERVGEKSFKEQLEEKIFTPLGMNNTTVVDNKNTVIMNKAYSYNLSGNNYIKNPVKLSTIGSSGIFTTIEDLGLWVKNYQKITFGKREFYERMQTITVLNSGKKTNYGLGLQHDKHKGIDVVFHGGGTESYRSYILHAPEHELSLIFLSNKGGMLGLDVMYNALEIILKDAIQEKKVDKTVNNKNLKKLEGTYEIFPGSYYTFIAEKGNLYFQEFGRTDKTLLPVLDKNVFNFPLIPHSRFTFYKDHVDFHIADMTYPCAKTVLKLPKPESINLYNFTGTYKNTEHNTSYDLVVRNNNLIATHNNKSYDIVLKPLGKNSFYGNQSYFGKIDFITNTNGVIESLKVSGQNLKNIVFKKSIE